MIGQTKEKCKMSNEAKSGALAVRTTLMQQQDKIGSALPAAGGLTPERMIQLAMSAYHNNKEIANCTSQSFFIAVMQCAQLGLEPNTPLGSAYLIPYKGTVTLQLGYRGLIELAYRSDYVKSIRVHTVWNKEPFEYTAGLEETLKHTPLPPKARGTQVVGYYCVIKLKDGITIFDFMWKEEVDKIRDISLSKTINKASAPWVAFEEQMGQKTIIRRTLKRAPLRTEHSEFKVLQVAAARDELVELGIDTDGVTEEGDYVGEVEDTIPSAQPNRIKLKPYQQELFDFLKSRCTNQSQIAQLLLEITGRKSLGDVTTKDVDLVRLTCAREDFVAFISEKTQITDMATINNVVIELTKKYGADGKTIVAEGKPVDQLTVAEMDEAKTEFLREVA